MADFPEGVEQHGSSIRVRWTKRVDGVKRYVKVLMPGSPQNQRDLNAAARVYRDTVKDLRTGMITWPELVDRYSKQPKIEKQQAETEALSYRDAVLQFEKKALAMVRSEAKKSKGKKKGWAKSTVNDQLAILKNTWIPVFGHRSLRSIQTQEIQKWINENCHLNKKTLKNRVSALRRVFKHHVITPNPCPAKEFVFPDEEQVAVLRYRPVEVDALLEYLQDRPMIHLYFSIFRYCGLRTGELLALKWSDFDGQFLRVTKSIVARELKNTTKTYTKRRVYVPAYARNALEEYKAAVKGGKVVSINQDDFIFLNTKGTVFKDADTFCDAWKQAHENVRLASKDADKLYDELCGFWDDEDIGEYLECKIPYRIPYTLRHTRAAELISQGQADKGPRELGHTRAMFESNYGEILKEYQDRDEDYSLLESRA